MAAAKRAIERLQEEAGQLGLAWDKRTADAPVVWEEKEEQNAYRDGKPELTLERGALSSARVGIAESGSHRETWPKREARE